MCIEIRQPRWKDRVVLIATYKVGKGKNLVRFTQAKSLPDIYSCDYRDIVRCPIQSNGTIDCYAVPLSLFKTERRIS